MFEYQDLLTVAQMEDVIYKLLENWSKTNK